MNRVLVIGLSWEQQPLLERIHSRGCELYGVHQYGAEGQRRAEELGDRFSEIHLCDLRDLAAICQYADCIDPDWVIADQCDYSHFAQALVAQRLGLSGPSIDAAQISCNKLLQRTRAREQGIDIPEFVCCTTLAEAEAASQQIGLPVILKPVDNRGSFGVHKVESRDQLEAAFESALIHSHSRLILVEEFIEGTQITVDGYVCQHNGCRSLGLATKRLLPDTSHQVAVDIVYPGELDPSLRDQAMQLNARVNTLLGYQFGMTHSEYMVTPEGRIVLIESANRGGGCFTSQVLVPHVSGIDLIDVYIRDAMGLENPALPDPRGKPAILKFFTFPYGYIQRINGFEELLRADGVLAGRLMIGSRGEARAVDSDAGRHGFIIYADPSAESTDQLRQAAERMIATIEVEYASQLLAG